jgi:hypothetical protein
MSSNNEESMRKDTDESNLELTDSALNDLESIDRWRQQTLDDELLGIKGSCLILLFQLFLSQCQNLDDRPINTNVKFDAYLAKLKPHQRMIFEYLNVNSIN